MDEEQPDFRATVRRGGTLRLVGWTAWLAARGPLYTLLEAREHSSLPRRRLATRYSRSMIARGQLSLMEMPRVVLEYHRARQPPDATGPFEHGTFSAALGGGGAPTGWGRTESLALTALAEELRDVAQERDPAPGLSVFDQALAAARRMPLDELVRWLAERAEVAVLHEPGPHPPELG